MEFIKTFYGDTQNLREILFKGIDTHLRNNNISPSALDELCLFEEGTWERIRNDHSAITADVFIDACFGLELNIEDAMPLDPTGEQLAEAIKYMQTFGESIDKLNLRTITSNRIKCKYGESVTIGQLCSKTTSELFEQVRNFGEQDLTNIQEELKKLDLRLKPE